MTSTSGQPEITPIPTTVELPLEITQATTVATSADDLQRTLFTTPHQTAPIMNNTKPPGAPNRDREHHAETELLAVEENTPELVLNDFVSQHYEALTNLMREEAKRRSGLNLHARLNFGPEKFPPRHYERENNERRTNVHDRLGTASNSQYSEEYEDNERQATSIPGLAVEEYKTDLDDNEHQVKDPPGLEVGEFMTDWEGDLPQVKAPQTLPLKKDSASAAEKITLPLVTPRTTWTKRHGTGNPEENVAKKRMKTYPFLGVVRKLMHLQDASAITLIARKGACPLM